MNKYLITITGQHGTTQFSLKNISYAAVWNYLLTEGWQLPYLGYILEVNIREVS
jgi:hypothetical protein